MTKILLGLGANLGDRRANLDEALVRLRAVPRVEVIRSSRYYETVPVGGPANQPPFLNAALLITTDDSPQELLGALQQIESDLGRVRVERWGPRTIDVDILLWDTMVLNTPELTIPHPRFAERVFALSPAAEIAPDMIHPVENATVAELLRRMKTTDELGERNG